MGLISRARSRCWRVSHIIDNTAKQSQSARTIASRFIRQVGERNDTPSLIMLIAADADYLKLCRSIVDPAAESNRHLPKPYKRLP
jgi:hypothetical protein